MEKTVIAVIGCGDITRIYFPSLTRVLNNLVTLKGVCDLIPQRAKYAQDTYGIPVIYPTEDDVLADEAVSIVVNLTQPSEHARLNRKILESGKHLYTEKPLAMAREEGAKLLRLAEKKNLLIAGAPDTFLGAGLQTARRVLESGRIGKPLSAVAFMTCHGHESWHPDPEYYYKPGAGPMMDMGPYYLTALTHLLGPIDSVMGSVGRGFDQRTITNKTKYGQVIDVEVSTHVAGLINFKSGAIANMMMSFDVWKANLPHIEIYGTQGTLCVPDPDTFHGPVRVFCPGMESFEEIPLEGFSDNTRGMGVADLACAIRNGRTPRAHGRQLYHVLDAMEAFEDSCREGIEYRLRSTTEIPPMLPENMTAQEWAQVGD
ncbi:MAG: Gfo/Idh/MocA family oxidoreductase [Eubacteriales bacterium]|nr:Gfo/Idh/MocA family oxidoreductase [Eubacteriales bacterium]